MTRYGLAALLLASAAHAQQPAPIQDNSFLIEEAYNQEARVVQHISAFFRSGNAWWYNFTQEWPLWGQRSQFSYTVPLTRDGFGDVMLNYRFQLAGPQGRLAVSPRISVVLPDNGLQVNLPVSLRVAPRVVTHWNAGATVTRAGSGSIWTYGLGASAILEARHDVNALVELVWSRTDGSEELFLNPGIRWAHTFRNGLQIVPGIGVPISLGSGGRETAVFLYLSFEHPF